MRNTRGTTQICAARAAPLLAPASHMHSRSIHGEPYSIFFRAPSSEGIRSWPLFAGLSPPPALWETHCRIRLRHCRYILLNEQMLPFIYAFVNIHNPFYRKKKAPRTGCFSFYLYRSHFLIRASSSAAKPLRSLLVPPLLWAMASNSA